MCAPPTTSAAAGSGNRTKKVVVVGAGPAGLLTAILLLRRNHASGGDAPKYEVTLVDPGPDFGKLDADQLGRRRSWMIGLSSHGLGAIRTVPGLYENYVRGLGVDIERAVFALSRRVKFDVKATDFLPNEDSAFTVDRNFICAALARYLRDNFEGNDDGEDTYTPMYNTRALFVDGDNNRILVRGEGDGQQQSYVDYDLLIGCDGIRSVVRNALATNHRDFECSVKSTFAKFKALHVIRPDDVAEGTFMFLNESLPNMGSFVLPETGNKLNISFGTNLNTPVADELLSDDVDVVKGYFQKHFSAFRMDCDDAAQQWVSQGWSTTGQVRCNFYHSSEMKILLMGDAAHATSPAIGQGMNTALADAAAFDELLDVHKGNLEAVLPAFSSERVKEGNALTDLSFYTFSLSKGQQFAYMLSQNLHRLCHKFAPVLVGPHPMDEVSNGGKLSVAYDKMSRLGIVQRIRYVNDRVMQEHFERTTGMVAAESGAASIVGAQSWAVAIAAAASAAAVAVFAMRRT